MAQCVIIMYGTADASSIYICFFIAWDKFITYVRFTPVLPLYSHSLSFFYLRWPYNLSLYTYTHTHTFFFQSFPPSPLSQPSILQCVALSSLIPLLPCPFLTPASFLRSLSPPVLPLHCLLSPCLLSHSFPSIFPLSLVLFINLLGCYSPCLTLLMKAGCRWGRRSSP